MSAVRWFCLLANVGLLITQIAGVVLNLRLRRKYSQRQHPLPTAWRRRNTLTIAGFVCTGLGSTVLIGFILLEAMR